MNKPYPRHRTRVLHDLRGSWQFAWLGDGPGDWMVEEVALSATMPVPSCFDAMPDYAGRRGQALYCKRVQVQKSGRVRLEFEAISMWARIYWDGVMVHEQPFGYTPFEVVMDAVEAGWHEVWVLVDNRYQSERSPMHEEYYDFYQWGGITRGVWLHELPDVAIEYVEVRTIDLGGRIEARIQLSQEAEVHFELDEKSCSALSAEWNPSTRLLTAHFNGVGWRPWSPEHPELHTLRVVLPADDYEVRFGLRTIETRYREILLNGKPLLLKGYNRHEFHPQYGASVPLAQVYADLQLIKATGANFIRGSHYPQCQQFLDACDELGILVWEETLGWQQREKQLTNPAYLLQHDAMVMAMIRRSCNHPSIILWGFLNECRSDQPFARPVIESTARLIRSLDSTRLITFATMFPFVDRCADLVDVFSVNTYPGWYECEGHPNPLSLVAPRIEEIARYHVENHPEGQPLLISEIGVEALQGWCDSMNGFFTEDYQARYMETTLNAILSNPIYSGVAIWQFSDARTYSNGYSINRPRSYNNKGIFDEYRRPKQSAAVVTRAFKAFPNQKGNEVQKASPKKHATGRASVQPSDLPLNLK